MVPGLSLNGNSVVLDCANGAASAIAPELFATLGGDAASDPLRSRWPQHQRALRRAAPGDRRRRDVPRAKRISASRFDGDADRALFADENGNVVNGDAVLLLAARDLQAARPAHATTPSSPPPCPTWASKPRSAQTASSMLRAAVGDKYVLDR